MNNQKSNNSDTFIVIGLGNIDKNYKDTYHNIGYLFIDWYIEELIKENIKIITRSTPWGSYSFSESNPKIIFTKTNSYMNDSGQSIKKILFYFKLKPKNLVIVHDDTDLFISNFKFKRNSGSGGHNGVESIQNILKTKDFLRLKIGVRNLNNVSRLKASLIVLKKISKVHKLLLIKSFGLIKKNFNENLTLS